MRQLARVILIGLVSSCGSAYAQTVNRQPSFEVASIKPAGSLTAALSRRGPGAGRIGFSGGPGTNDPGLLTCHLCVMTLMLMEAYHLQPFQLSPGWKDSLEAFELSAKVPEGATKEQVRLMLQNVLVERFKLAIHRETKELQVYEMVVAKGGLKLKESVETPDSPEPSDNPQPPATDARPTFDKDGFVVRPPGWPNPKGRLEVGMGGKHRIRAGAETMQDLAERLSSVLGKPVIDATGLEGKYDYSLIFEQAALMGGRGNAPPAGASGANNPFGAASDDTVTPIESAIQSQLGLRLVSKKGPTDIIVVDHVEKVPTEN
jgi:uncharacterized protein (TIGR03435 family)